MSTHFQPDQDQGILTTHAARRLFLSGIYTLVVFTVGTLVLYGLGLQAGKEWSLFDCVYFAMITMSTVGYGETLLGMETLTSIRLVTMFLIVGGMGAMVLFASNITAFFIEGDIQRIWRGRRTVKAIENMSGHVVLCGVGQTGFHVARELLSNQSPFVVIDPRPEPLDRVLALGSERGWQPPTIQGDATDDDVLERAGIRRARGLVTTIGRDQDNLFIIVSARQMNPQLRIVSKAVQPDSISKLERAGADGVVAPEMIGGLRIASELVRPAVVTFLDEMRKDTDRNIRIEDIHLPQDSPLVGTMLRDTGIREQTQALVLAIRGANDEYHYNPPGDYSLEPGDALVVLADQEQVQHLRQICGDPTPTVTLQSPA